MKIKNNKNIFRLILTIVVVFFASSFSFLNAQTTTNEGISTEYIQTMLLVGFLLTFIAFVFLLLFGMEDREDPSKQVADFFRKAKDKFVGAVPVEQEDEILLEDDYDGIKELDNRIPPWFNILFYATVIFAIYYLLDYHVFKTGKLQYQEYQAEMQAAEIQKAALMSSGTFVNENNVTQLTDIGSLNSGQNIFKTNCVPCHGPDAGGVVGPNLTDEYWIHGGGIKNIFSTIKYGVPAKGMISWQTQLTPKKIQEVASYVMSLQGSKPANPKPPEGDKYIPPKDTTETK